VKKLIFIVTCGAVGVLLLAFAAEQFNILHGGSTAHATGIRAVILRDSYIIVGAIAGFAVWWWLDDDDDD
jgi:hypothetical protein